MFRTLFARLSAALVALNLVLSIALVVVLQSSHQSFHLEIEQRERQELAQRLVGGLGSGPAMLDRLFEQVRQLAVLNPAIAAYVLAEDGTVVASSRPAQELKRQRVAVDPVLAFLQGPAAWPVVGDDPANERASAIFSAARLASAPGPAFLYVVLGSGDNENSLTSPGELSYSLREALVLTLANVAAALLAAMVVVALVTRPLRRLGRAMDAFDATQFAGGARYGRQPARRSRDEIDRLGGIFDSMADRIALQVESLRRSEQARRELYANVSHDLETPLTSLVGYVQTLIMKEKTLTPADRRRYLEIVQRQSEQLRELVGQITDLARLEMPATRLQLDDVQLETLLRRIVEDMTPVIERKTLKTVLHVENVSVRADPGLLRRALSNILLNAAQAAPEGSEIVLRLAKATDGTAEITIADRGPGLRTGDIERVFEPGYRRSRASGAGSPGMGLGLAIARRIVELHGGTIRAANEGNGAVFRVHLPSAGSRGSNG